MDGFYRHLCATGVLFQTEVNAFGDADILSLWVVEKKKKKTSKGQYVTHDSNQSRNFLR